MVLPSPSRFGVDGSERQHERRQVCYRVAQHEAAAVGAFDVERLVEVLRAPGVEGDERHLAQVERRQGRGGRLGLPGHRVGKPLGHIVLLAQREQGGLLGGGDVKLAAAIAIGLPPAATWEFIFATTMVYTNRPTTIDGADSRMSLIKLITSASQDLRPYSAR